MHSRTFFFRLAALALIYAHGGFQLELDEEEYARNHPAPASTPTLSPPWENWESWDKTDAKPAFTIRVDREVVLQCWLPAHPVQLLRAWPPSRPVRDKSPPVLF